MQTLIKYALSFIGIPYRWGGKSAGGFDCSGVVSAILQGVGAIHTKGLNSQGLYDHFIKKTNGEKIAEPQPGALIFYGTRTTAITHISFAIDYWRMVEAGGGDSTTTTPARAQVQGAFVRMRPIDFRKDMVAIIMPKYRYEVINGN